MARIGVFTESGAEEVVRATKQVLNFAGGGPEEGRAPFVTQPVYRVKITGGADANGIYPGKLMRLNASNLAWTELGDCLAYKVDTI